MSIKSFLFLVGIIIVLIFIFSELKIFSLTPPIGSTLPCRVISPVIAMLLSTGFLVKAEYTEVVIVIPADGPSLGTAPSGTCRCISISEKLTSSIPSFSALERKNDIAI